jgi:hypothetical protein
MLISPFGTVLGMKSSTNNMPLHDVGVVMRDVGRNVALSRQFTVTSHGSGIRYLKTSQ